MLQLTLPMAEREGWNSATRSTHTKGEASRVGSSPNLVKVLSLATSDCEGVSDGSLGYGNRVQGRAQGQLIIPPGPLALRKFSGVGALDKGINADNSRC